MTSTAVNMWEPRRLDALKDTLYTTLEGVRNIEDQSPGMQASVEFLRPLWSMYATPWSRRELIRIYVEPYAFPHTKAMYAAMKDTGIDMDIVSQVTPDNRSMSVQLFVEAGFWGEGYELMERRCSTRDAISRSFNLYFEQRRMEDSDDIL